MNYGVNVNLLFVAFYIRHIYIYMPYELYI